MRKFYICIILFALTACGHAEKVDTPYKAEFDMYLSWVLTDFERDVLGDYKIEEHEFLEAKQRYLDCLEPHGITASVYPDGTGYVNYPIHISEIDQMSKYSALDTKCHSHTLSNIGTLYAEIRRNPENRDIQQGILDCAIQKGLLEPGSTYTEDQADIDAIGGVSEYIDCVRDPFGLLQPYG